MPYFNVILTETRNYRAVVKADSAEQVTSWMDANDDGQWNTAAIDAVFDTDYSPDNELADFFLAGEERGPACDIDISTKEAA